MHKRQLGNTDMYITPIGLGTWAMGGGGWTFGWGEQDDKESIMTIKRAVQLGVNWIDTAAVYGLGRAEEIVGQAIKGLERPYIFTKCSLVWDNKSEISNSLKAQSIEREAEASLKRLGIDAIDLYQIHWPNPDSDIEEGWLAMEKLHKAGKVRAIGVSNFDVGQMQRAQRIAPIASLQPPYSLLDSEIEKEILPYCEQQNIGVIVYSPMASGLLTGMMTRDRINTLPDDDWRKHDPNFQEPLLTRNLALADVLTEIGYLHGVSAGVVAISWTLRDPVVTGAIVGARHPVQIEELLPAAELRLQPAELEQIDKFLHVKS